MPPRVLVFTLDNSDRTEEQSDAEADIAKRVQTVLLSVAAASGAQTASGDTIYACGLACSRFFAWGGLASLEIGLQRAQVRDFGLHSVADVAYGDNLSPVRAVLNADFALFVVLRQVRLTKGRQVAEFFTYNYRHTVDKQIDVACMADLRDGHMTWCANRIEDWRDLSERGQISKTLRDLLADVLGLAGH